MQFPFHFDPGLEEGQQLRYYSMKTALTNGELEEKASEKTNLKKACEKQCLEIAKAKQIM